jgi:hypothetical protein
MRDETKSKMNDVKTKAAKPTKLQELKAEAQEAARAKARAKEDARVAANEAHAAAVREADKEAGNGTSSEENSEWENEDGIDPKSKEARLARAIERKKARNAKKWGT